MLVVEQYPESDLGSFKIIICINNIITHICGGFLTGECLPFSILPLNLLPHFLQYIGGNTFSCIGIHIRHGIFPIAFAQLFKKTIHHTIFLLRDACMKGKNQEG